MYGMPLDPRMMRFIVIPTCLVFASSLEHHGEASWRRFNIVPTAGECGRAIPEASLDLPNLLSAGFATTPWKDFFVSSLSLGRAFTHHATVLRLQ